MSHQEYKTLLVETATHKGLFAFAQGRQLLWSQVFALGQSRQVPLLPLLDSFFQQQGLCPADLDLLVVGIGPGSYTGMRLGVAAVKALAYAIDRPVVGISSLFSYCPSEFAKPFVTVFDAKLGGLYCATAKRTKQGMEILRQPALLSWQEFETELQGTGLVVGPAVLSIREKAREKAPDLLAQWEEQDPDPLPMLIAAWDKWEKGEVCWDGDLPLLYF